MPNITLVVVTWNSAACIRQTLQAIQAQTYPSQDIRTVVVDNASRDETVTMIRDQFPWVTLLAENINHGFAVANNIAMRRYPADYYALVNHDAVLHPEWLSHMLEAFEADPTIGVAGSKIFYGNRILLQHTGGMLRDNALTYHLGANEFDIGQYDQPHEIDYATGAALVTRGPLANSLNFLPEVYFLYFEEVEYCLRVRQAGYRIVYVPSAIAYHDEKYSLSGHPNIRYLWLYHCARYLFALRNITTTEARHKFTLAERQWRQAYVHSGVYRLLLVGSKLIHWRLLYKQPWLLNG